MIDLIALSGSVFLDHAAVFIKLINIDSASNDDRIAAVILLLLSLFFENVDSDRGSSCGL